jgi:hypothetical protein
MNPKTGTEFCHVVELFPEAEVHCTFVYSSAGGGWYQDHTAVKILDTERGTYWHPDGPDALEPDELQECWVEAEDELMAVWGMNSVSGGD